MQRGWESEIGGPRPGAEMVGGDYSSRPRPCMGCSTWVDGWMDLEPLAGTLLDLVPSLILVIYKMITFEDIQGVDQ
jgi:hypothetical protein